MWFLLAACTGDPAPSEQSPEPGEPTCNGQAHLCERPLDEVALAVAHNAMNVEEEGWTAPNQRYGYETQVADGIRGFMLDVHDLDGVPTLCHGACSLGSQPLQEGLARFDALLDAWPDDVFVFVVQDEMDAPPI